MKRKKPESLPLFGDAGPSKPRAPRDTGLAKGLKADKYELDEDGFVREIVGEWAQDKHARLSRYVDISAPTRRKWIRSGATYIDLFAGPGRCRIRNTADVIDGSPLCAWRMAVSENSAFTAVVVADAHSTLAEAAQARLVAAGAPATSIVGAAEDTVDAAIARVPAKGLHLAFLDPFDLATLPFTVITKLAKLEHMDILIHVSLLDLNRNLRRYIEADHSPLDVFAPRWRESVDVEGRDANVRSQIFQHWRSLLRTIGMKTAETAELVSGSSDQPLYLLAFAARHPLALKFWEAVRNLSGQRDYLHAL